MRKYYGQAKQAIPEHRVAREKARRTISKGGRRIEVWLEKTGKDTEKNIKITRKSKNIPIIKKATIAFKVRAVRASKAISTFKIKLTIETKKNQREERRNVGEEIEKVERLSIGGNTLSSKWLAIHFLGINICIFLISSTLTSPKYSQIRLVCLVKYI